jgi:hypothetical protein
VIQELAACHPGISGTSGTLPGTFTHLGASVHGSRLLLIRWFRVRPPGASRRGLHVSAESVFTFGLDPRRAAAADWGQGRCTPAFPRKRFTQLRMEPRAGARVRYGRRAARGGHERGHGQRGGVEPRQCDPQQWAQAAYGGFTPEPCCGASPGLRAFRVLYRPGCGVVPGSRRLAPRLVRARVARNAAAGSVICLEFLGLPS